MKNLKPIHLFNSLTLLFIGAISLFAQQPSCSDGIQNRDEVGVDCGGAYCADCENEYIGVQRVSTANLCLSIPDHIADFPDLAISDNGEKYIIGFENKQTGSYEVYTGRTDGSEFQQIFKSGEPWSQVLSPIVNISKDGKKVLWTDSNYDGIYVANYDGSGQFKIAQEHQSEIGKQRTYVESPVMFNNAGDKIFFRNDAGGQINLIYRNGIFAVGLDQVVADPLVINKDLQERYETEIDYYSSHEIFDFKRDDQDRIVFSTNILGGRYYGDLFMLEGGDFSWMGIRYVPNNEHRFDISADGLYVAWQEQHPDSTAAARVYKHNLMTGDQKYYYFEEWASPYISLNHNGELLEMHLSGVTLNAHILINDQGQVFPSMQMYASHSLRKQFSDVMHLSMSAFGERLIFAQYTDDYRNSLEVWSVDWSPELVDNPDFSQLSEMNFTPGYAVYDNETQYATFQAKYDPEFPAPEWIEYISYEKTSLFQKGMIWSPLLVSTIAGSGYDRLVNDGMTRGDEMIDNIFTENELYPNYKVFGNGQKEVATGSIRINLYTNNENNITSYEFGPFIAYQQGGLVSIENKEIEETVISTSLDSDYLYIKNAPKIDAPFSYHIYSIDGRQMQQGQWEPLTNSSINISGLGTGQFVFVLMDNYGRFTTSAKIIRAH